MVKDSFPRLKLLPASEYIRANQDDPIRLYQVPFLNRLYRRRVECCLDKLTGGQRILEVGFGSGVTFFNLYQLYPEIYGIDLTPNVEQISQFFAQRGIPTHLHQGSVLNLPFENDFFDSVLLISILEHLRPEEQTPTFNELVRVLKPGGQVVYGVPVERPLMVFMFRLLGFDIRQYHFSTEEDVRLAARQVLSEQEISSLFPVGKWGGKVYEVGHFVKV